MTRPLVVRIAFALALTFGAACCHKGTHLTTPAGCLYNECPCAPDEDTEREESGS